MVLNYTNRFSLKLRRSKKEQLYDDDFIAALDIIESEHLEFQQDVNGR